MLLFTRRLQIRSLYIKSVDIIFKKEFGMINIQELAGKTVSNKILVRTHSSHLYSKIYIYVFEVLKVAKIKDKVLGFDIIGGRDWVGGSQGVNIASRDADIFAQDKVPFLSFKYVRKNHTTWDSVGGDLKFDDAFVCDDKDDLAKELPEILAHYCHVSVEDVDLICKDILNKLFQA